MHSMTVRSINKDDSKHSSSQDPMSNLEKGEASDTTEGDVDELDSFSHEHPFPELPNSEIETQQFTFRAVLVGCLLGGVISASKYEISSRPKKHSPLTRI